MARVAAERHEKRVEREVLKTIEATEPQPSTSGKGAGDELSADKLEALRVCNEKRTKARK